MRILHLTNDVYDFGNGIINVAVDLACAQSRRGDIVGVASAGGTFENLLRQHGVSHWNVDQGRRKPYQLPGVTWALWQAIHEFKPDIVHAHMMTGAVLARLLSPFTSFHLVTSVHNSWQRGVQAMRLGDRVIAVSKAVADEMAKRGFNPERIDVVPNGPLGTPRRAAPVNRSRPAKPIRFLTVAGMYKRKGIADLLQAYRLVVDQCPDVMLHLVGDGPDRDAFEALATNLSLTEKVSFEGHIPDPTPFYEKAHAFVLASHAEPFGLCIIEARAAGNAVIASRTGGIPEALSDGHAGILVDAGDVSELGKAMLMLATKPDVLTHWSKMALNDLDKFNVERMVDDTSVVYQKSMAGKTALPAGKGEFFR